MRHKGLCLCPPDDETQNGLNRKRWLFLGIAVCLVFVGKKAICCVKGFDLVPTSKPS